MSYLPCELHCHTVHSDGDFQVNELLERAKDDHLSLIALTDHNTISGWDELDDTITPAVRGIEWTTYHGHMLVLGAKEFIDWRDATDNNIDDKINQIKAVGGIVGIAHPFQIGSPICTGGRWEYKVKDFHNIDYMEIWHEDLSRIGGENVKAFELWTSLLDQGYKIACTYGRDWHRMEKSGHFGCTYVDIEGEVNQEHFLHAMRLGKTVVSSGAKFFFNVHRHGNTYSIGDTVHKGTYTFSFFTDLHSREKNKGDESVKYKSIKVVTNCGRVIMESACSERHVRLTLEKNHWYRAELWGTVDGDKTLLAVTSPLYCQ
jgi:hypothetical protein